MLHRDPLLHPDKPDAATVDRIIEAVIEAVTAQSRPESLPPIDDLRRAARRGAEYALHDTQTHQPCVGVAQQARAEVEEALWAFRGVLVGPSM